MRNAEDGTAAGKHGSETHMSQDLLKRIQEDQVKFICLQFTDVTGTVKSTDMPAGRLGDALTQGVWFDGSSVEGFARIQESDMMLRLDPDTYPSANGRGSCATSTPPTERPSPAIRAAR
jgi:glutamine synthetase